MKPLKPELGSLFGPLFDAETQVRAEEKHQ